MHAFQCAALLFDLDGVLVDSTPAVVRVWTEWARENGLDPSHVLKLVHGRRTAEVLQILAPDADIRAQAYQIEDAISQPSVRPIPGAARLLSGLPADRWCVVTSSIGELARNRLGYAGLPLPQVLVSADDVVNGKPHPEPYLKGAALLGAEPEQCMVLEDAPNGIRSGHAGGMKVIGVATTYPPSELQEADAVVKTLEEVTARIVDARLHVEAGP